MGIPDSNNAVADKSKVRDYLLNLEHPDGGSKAVWFHNRGYLRDQWQLLADDLLAIARNCKFFDTESNPYGIKYIATGNIGRPGHTIEPVLTVWIVEDSSPPRLVTSYPKD